MLEPDTAFVALKLLFALSPLLGLGVLELVLYLRDRRRSRAARRPGSSPAR